MMMFSCKNNFILFLFFNMEKQLIEFSISNWGLELIVFLVFFSENDDFIYLLVICVLSKILFTLINFCYLFVYLHQPQYFILLNSDTLSVCLILVCLFFKILI